MSVRTIYVENYEDNVLKDASSVVLSNPTGLWGIREKLSGTVIVAALAPTVKESTGVYTYVTPDLDDDLEYEYYFKITRTNLDVEYVAGTIPVFTPAISASYATLLEAQAYFDARLNTDAWDDSLVTDKSKALMNATKIIDRLNFKGVKTDASQALQFPRDNDTVVPDDIKFACAEVALALLDGVDPELEFENLNMVSQGYANVRSTYDRSLPSEHIAAGIPSVSAWRYLKPYLRDVNTVDVSRVS